jgi:hypothetical protein
MKITKFVVKVIRSDARTVYVRRMDSSPMEMTLDRKLALVMGKLVAEDALKALRSSKCTPEIVSVPVAA